MRAVSGAELARAWRGAQEAHRQEAISAADDPVAAALDAGRTERAVAGALTGRPVVTRHTALSLPATWRCATMIATDVGGLDIAASDGGDWPLLTEPEPGTPVSYTVEQTVMGLVLDGNVVWRITMRDSLGVPAAAQVVPSEDLWIHLDPRTRRITEYRWRGMVIPDEDVIHFRGPGLPGWPVGLSPLATLDRTIGNALGQDQAAAEMLISGWLPMVVLSPRDPDQGLTADEVAQYRTAWAARAGRDRGPMIVGGDMTASTLSFDPSRLQMLESREHADRQICTALGVPPRMAGVPYPDSSTYNNVQQEQAGYKARALMGWIRRIEATLSAQLPLGVRAEMDDTTLDRGDPLTQAQAAEHEARAELARAQAAEARARAAMAVGGGGTGAPDGVTVGASAAQAEEATA